MNFQDSFFESSSSDSEAGGVCDTGAGPKVEKKVVYNARWCEPRWFMSDDELHPLPTSISASIHSIEFTVVKHKADLLYHQKEYKEASELYKKMLPLVPESNACVLREIRDGLARCWLRLGEGVLAKQEAEKLVLPPHEKDWSAWKLLGRCHELLQDYEAQVIAIQTSVSLQRCHSNFWVYLSEGYKKLQSAMSQNKPRSGPCSCNNGGTASVSPEKLKIILIKTVQLFRPYFSWRTKVDEDNVTEDSEPECIKELDSSHLADANRDSDSPMSQSVTSFLSCTEHCVLYNPSDLQDSSYYISTILRLSGAHLSPSLHKESVLLPEVCLPLCFCHSPFVMLVRHLLEPEVFVKLVEDLCGSSVAQQLLGSVYAMAECSCLVWARYSHSFPKDSVQFQLREVEGRLETCHAGTRNYIVKYFSKRTVFDER